MKIGIIQYKKYFSPPVRQIIKIQGKIPKSLGTFLEILMTKGNDLLLVHTLQKSILIV